jgi:hypothetical protein
MTAQWEFPLSVRIFHRMSEPLTFHSHLELRANHFPIRFNLSKILIYNLQWLCISQRRRTAKFRTSLWLGHAIGLPTVPDCFSAQLESSLPISRMFIQNIGGIKPHTDAARQWGWMRMSPQSDTTLLGLSEPFPWIRIPEIDENDSDLIPHTKRKRTIYSGHLTKSNNAVQRRETKLFHSLELSKRLAE